MTHERRLRHFIRVALLSAAYFVLVAPVVPVRADAECSQVCTSNSECDTACTPDGTCGDYGVCDQDCDVVCDQYTDCSQECIGDGPEWITCGDYGICYCDPDWQQVGSSWISGAWAVDDAPNNRCEHWVAESSTWHDNNGCYDDYTGCTEYLNATDTYGMCCVTYWCGGSMCA